MRITSALYRRPGRRPALEPFLFQERLPLALKDSVSGKGDKSSEVVCLQEMSVMLACFKKNEFNEIMCSQEVDSFKKCFKGFKDSLAVKAKQEAEGTLGLGATGANKNKLPYQKVNKLLEKFPQPR